MPEILTVILFSVGAVGIFVLGMSLTLILKGHNIKSEIGDNEHMQQRGIKCVVDEARQQDGTAAGDCGDAAGCSSGSCAVCETPQVVRGSK